MKTRTHGTHLGSFLVGILIGGAAILILLATLPGSYLAARSSAGQNEMARSLDNVGLQLRAAWNHLEIKAKSFTNISLAISRPCQQFRNLYNQQDEKLFNWLAQHGMHLPLWLLPLTMCQ